MRNLNCNRLQCDEIWAFVGAKAKNVSPERKADGWGDIWTCIDADSKLVPWWVGGRTGTDAVEFMDDVASRLSNRVQLTTDGLNSYLVAVNRAFEGRVDYATLHKLYGPDANDVRHRYSPGFCTGVESRVIFGDPDPGHVSTSYVERANLTMRMGMRRFTRLSNGFSKKVENHAAAVALHFQFYNFARPHKSLKNPYPRTPAMAAGVADHFWTLEEIAGLLD